MKTPCKDCAFRAVGCHAFCKPYLEYREELDNARKEREKHYPVRDMQIEKSIQTAKRARRLKK